MVLRSSRASRLVATSSITRDHHQHIARLHTLPSSAQLDAAAYFSCLSGLAYRTDTELQQHLSRKRLHLVAAGSSSFTRWFVAEGALPAGAHTTTTYTRAVLIRGVDWRGTNAAGRSGQLWRDLGRCWPVPLLPALTRPPEALVCHAGVADMAAQLYEELAPHCHEPGVVFAG